MSLPLAYFLTWTVHGTWLHGDDRGSVDADHNRRTYPRVSVNIERQGRAEMRMASPPRLLSDEARHIVTETIKRHCEFRGWRLLALNVRTNHVHVVVDCGGTHTPEQAMEQFKAWATRRLREAGLADPGARVWTEHGSTRWINDAESLNAAVAYVVNQ